MDQLKPILENAYKYRFWIICGLVVSVSLVFSFMAASGTRAQIKREKDAIKASFDQVRLLSSKENPPNDNSHKAMDAKISSVKEGVREAWQKQYNNQNSGPNKLVWPAALGKDFIDEVVPLHPIERIAYPTPSDDEILDLHRLNYRNYIQKELPALSAIIDAKWHPVNEYVKADDKEDEKKYLVEWAAGNQTFLQNSRFDWGNSPPSTLDVLYSQEDLWVLRTLLQVIKDTNGSVEARYKAAIKRIDSILLGQDVTAMQDDAQIKEPAQAGGADGGYGGMDSSSGGMGMGMEMEDGMGGDSGAAMGGAAGAPTQGIPTGTRADPAHLRYVDNNFQGVGAKKVRDALTNPTGENALYAVAKRIPVRIQMSIDQRRLNKFLALCGNAPLQIEVKRVRINRNSSANPSGGGGGMGMGMDEFGGEDGEMGGEEMMNGAPGMGMGMEDGMGEDMMGGGGQVKKLADESPLDVDVEIYGMVYIYNPVDRELLGLPQAPQQPANPGTDGVPPQDAANDNQNAAAALPAANQAG